MTPLSGASGLASQTDSLTQGEAAMVMDDDLLMGIAGDDAGAVTVVAVQGDIKSAALARLAKLLGALADVPGPIVIDACRVLCRSGELLTMLRAFQAERHAGGQCCQLLGMIES
ncbi:hypothetical protein LQ327_00175 [Actinomycetospora endophytica]|uniref:STAS domain-containing protein n=1 Tax=Actinomycetospora endophytica TaxID=2291215 RepID=A0ABS8P0N9_9PSEU|nr:hypothetical protein [Actinomycetospora endophytica]MCD2191807.1 hypothetical protein [Actinomycetospora endophytica]